MDNRTRATVMTPLPRLFVAAILLAGVTVGIMPAVSCAAAPRTASVRLPVVAATASTQHRYHAATRAVDGRRATRWLAANGRYPQWIKLDLGTSCVVDAVRLLWTGAGKRTYAYRARTSLDGIVWRTFSAGRQARFVKITVLRCSVPSAWASLQEVRVLGSPVPQSTPSSPAVPAPDVPRTDRVISHLVLASGTHDVLYENVSFTGGGDGNPDSSGVIEIPGTAYRITFRNCVIASNTDGAGNGVKIVDRGGTVHDITFEGCHFMSQPRMGFECINRPGTRNAGYRAVNLINCTFEPQGAEAISYDDDSAGKAGNSLIQGCTVKGAGLNPDYPWGQGMEINGPTNMTVRNNRFYACRGDIWNLRMQVDSPCGWEFSDNVIDAATKYQSVPMDSDAGCIAASNITGGVFARNSVTSSAPGGGVTWLNDCHDMDWRTTTWYDARGSVYSTPFQVDCSGNMF
jgi:hypothetical protein